jgi:FlaA1/EpsC-like NDP-sugar epimerase
MPSQTLRRRQETVRLLEPLGVRIQSMPDLAHIVLGKAKLDELRDLDLNDLLGRAPVNSDQSICERLIKEKAVLITGAGGSIGSELCRQILSLHPGRLILVEMSEIALYSIDQELTQTSRLGGHNVEIVALLGNASNYERMREVMRCYGVQVVFHAAAYKHVPIVEQNVIEGLRNNVLSTLSMAEAAQSTGVETFVLISTDKAVNPVNVMGATKRLSELVLQALQARSSATRFCMVRFGNVLGSSGSVVPLFHEQIMRGGPITVTHPDIIRYFMTIPEASQLVVLAGSMGTGGDVFVLDMGEPVHIDRLARRMVRLMGLAVRDSENPAGDIEIQYTGLRGAEKLYEELLIGSNVASTEHPRIMRATEHFIEWDILKELLDELQVSMSTYDCDAAVAILARAVVEYNPGDIIRDCVWNRQRQ